MNVIEPELITIVEGPPPDFHAARELWPLSLREGHTLQAVAQTQMRTFNGQAMLDRCLRAWSEARPVMLDFPQTDGLRRKVEVLAARATTVDAGDVLHLWVAIPADEVSYGEDVDGPGDDAGAPDDLESDF